MIQTRIFLLTALAFAASAADAPIGRWTTGRISSVQFKNAITAAPAPANGNSFGYEFRPDGTYSFVGFIQSVAYNCTTTISSNETGTYSVQEDQLSLKPESNPYRMTNSCAPSSNREAPGKLFPRTYSFRILTGRPRNTLELRSPEGALQKLTQSR
jgi:hypothetical protein